MTEIVAVVCAYRGVKRRGDKYRVSEKSRIAAGNWDRALSDEQGYPPLASRHHPYSPSAPRLSP
jgi:hypothetical protein